MPAIPNLFEEPKARLKDCHTDYCGECEACIAAEEADEAKALAEEKREAAEILADLEEGIEGNLNWLQEQIRAYINDSEPDLGLHDNLPPGLADLRNGCNRALDGLRTYQQHKEGRK